MSNKFEFETARFIYNDEKIENDLKILDNESKIKEIIIPEEISESITETIPETNNENIENTKGDTIETAEPLLKLRE